MNGGPLAPTRTRYWVVVFAVTLAMIQYIDRICISEAGPGIQKALSLNDREMGFVFGVFTLAYSLFEIPTGWLGDRYGVRKVLVRVCLWWSLFTALTGRAVGYVSLLVIRFLFGVGEAGCFPNITKAFTTWLRPAERVRAQSILWLSARWGGAFTPLLVVELFKIMSWRSAFAVFGGLGVVWAIVFYLWFRDHPGDHPGVNKEELALLSGVKNLESRHAKVPWGAFLGSRSTWLLWAQYFCLSYGWYFYITWLPKYVKERGLGLELGAVLSGLPLLCGGVGSIVSGFLAPMLARRTGGMRRARRLLAVVGFVGAGSLVLYSIRVRDPVVALVLMGLAGFSNDLVMPCSWGACMDVGGKFAGTFSGSMNMMGNFGGAVGPIVVGFILLQGKNLEVYRRWAPAFYLSAAIYFLGAVCWLFIDSVTALDQGPTEGDEPPQSDRASA
jgi:MFS family permease